MSKRIAVAGVIGVLVGAGVLMAAPEADVSKRPNVVVICLQGVPASATGFGGNEVVKTPNLDALASEATQFTRAYTPIPQAGPARASLLTGQYPHTHRVSDDGVELNKNAVTFSEQLEHAGYTCGLVGSWRLPEGEKAKEAAGSGNGAVPPRGAVNATATLSQPPTGMMHPPETPLPGGPATPGRPGGPSNMHGAPGMPASGLQPGRPPIAGSQPAFMGLRPGLASSMPASSQPGFAASQPMMAESQPAEAVVVAPPPAPAPPPPPPPPPPVEKSGFGFKYSATSDLGGPLEHARVYIDGKQETADKYLPDWHTDCAVEFIEKSKSKPFMLCLFLPGPSRDSLAYPPGGEGLYPPSSLPNTPIEQPDAKNVPSRLRMLPLFQNSPKQPEQLRQQLSKYYANVTHLDENVGRVLKALSDADVDENTIVIVTSDQGYATGKHGAWGMGPAFWEEFVRCPLLVRLPVKERGEKKTAESSPAQTQAEGIGGAKAKAGRIERIVSLVDLAPTILDAVGLPVPLMMQGRTLLPMMAGNDDPFFADECFIEYEKENGQAMPARTLISGQYKFVDYLQDSDQFYDMKRDPKEEYNLVDVNAYTAVSKVMRARMDNWRKRTRDVEKR